MLYHAFVGIAIPGWRKMVQNYIAADCCLRYSTLVLLKKLETEVGRR